VICGIIRGRQQWSKNGARNFDSVTVFYDHGKNQIQHAWANVHLITCPVGTLAYGSDAQLPSSWLNAPFCSLVLKIAILHLKHFYCSSYFQQIVYLRLLHALRVIKLLLCERPHWRLVWKKQKELPKSQGFWNNPPLIREMTISLLLETFKECSPLWKPATYFSSHFKTNAV
jgi:hypothetical protein